MPSLFLLSRLLGNRPMNECVCCITTRLASFLFFGLCSVYIYKSGRAMEYTEYKPSNKNGRFISPCHIFSIRRIKSKRPHLQVREPVNEAIRKMHMYTCGPFSGPSLPPFICITQELQSAY